MTCLGGTDLGITDTDCCIFNEGYCGNGLRKRVGLGGDALMQSRIGMVIGILAPIEQHVVVAPQAILFLPGFCGPQVGNRPVIADER